MRHTMATLARPSREVLTRAVAAARYAPSILNTQPWRWRLEPGRLELFAERSRQLMVADPQGRLLTISCGAALHHARTALAAAGWSSQVARLPDDGKPDLLATLTVTGPIAGAEAATATDLAQAIPARHTDRRRVSDRPLPAAATHTIAAAARAEGELHILTHDQVLELAVAACRAAELQAGDPRVGEERAFWTGTAAPAGTGLPARVLPDHPAQTMVPNRDFGRTGTLPVGAGYGRAAVYALLFGDGDEPAGWLRSGEALSAAWLTATTLGVSVMPLSDVIEVVHTRYILRRMLSGLGYPHLAVRLGVADSDGDAGEVHTPRLATASFVDALADRPA